MILADGTRQMGYLTPPVHGDSDLGTLQPAIVTSAGQVSFWCGSVSPDATHIAEGYRRLGKTSPDQVFPLRFESEVALTTGSIHGKLPGFMLLEDFKTGRTRVIV